MTKTRADLTELEGAILGVIRLEPGATAYRVRQIFLASRSTEWSGSAGAVYPAIARLEALGRIRGGAQSDKRGTRSYRLTQMGERAHDHWLCDEVRAIGAGFDPFRTRAGFWSALPEAKYRALLTGLARRIRTLRNQLLRELPHLDDGDARMVNLHIALQDLRLDWVAAELKIIARKSR